VADILIRSGCGHAGIPVQSKRAEDKRLMNWNREIIVDSFLGSFRFENIASDTSTTKHEHFRR
jgi:hypothetical protein